MTAARENGRVCHDPVLVSVILPVYNEVAALDQLFRSVNQAIDKAGASAEIIFIDDGSSDGSNEALDRLAAGDGRVRVLHLSRNFGHQAALQAGLTHAAGDAVVVMDSDLQDDPAAIGRFLEKWREGYDVVYAIRTSRKESQSKRFLFFAFYRLLNVISKTPMPADAGNFSLLDQRVAREIARLLDRDRYFAGLRSWVGFRQVGIDVERGARYDDRPRVSMLGLARLAKSAIFSFSSFPLTVFYLIGWLALLVFLALAGFTLYHKLFTGLAIPGWASITMASSFFGALNALGIAVLGEYVTRIYEQVRSRPLYVIERRVNFPEEPRERQSAET
jgi:dolichol-phosphate mannosyltransferase